MTPSPRPELRLLTRLLCGLLGIGLSGMLGACSVDSEPDLAPLVELARGAAAETSIRRDAVQRFLSQDLAPLPFIGQLADATPDVAAQTAPTLAATMDWHQTPFLATALVNPHGALQAVLPRAAPAFADMLVTASGSPAVTGPLQIIPNTFTFTFAVNAPLPDRPGFRLTALVDVDRVLLDGVLHPLAQAAHGLAFLANRDARVVLSTSAQVGGRPLGDWGIPLPGDLDGAVTTIDLAGSRYHVATISVPGDSGWVIGVATPANESD